jgi:hypothetical protein
MSSEEVFWQSVLLGIEPEFSERRVFLWVLYCLFVAAVIMGAAALS